MPRREAPRESPEDSRTLTQLHHKREDYTQQLAELAVREGYTADDETERRARCGEWLETYKDEEWRCSIGDDSNTPIWDATYDDCRLDMITRLSDSQFLFDNQPMILGLEKVGMTWRVGFAYAHNDYDALAAEYANMLRKDDRGHEWLAEINAKWFTGETVAAKDLGMRGRKKDRFASMPGELTQDHVNQAIQEIVAKYPTATSNGIYRPKDGKLSSLVTLMNEPEILEEVRSCVEWIYTHDLLTGLAPVFHDSSAYAFKHNVENWVHDKGNGHQYISMMSFVIAAWILGLENSDHHNPLYRFDEGKVAVARQK